MWPTWSKTSTPPPRSFSFSTFKDILSLVSDENPGPPPPSQTEKTLPPPNKLPSIFHRVRAAASALRSWKNSTSTPEAPKRLVLYFTSIRVVRKTFDDCHAVRSILKGLRLAVDERDLSMHHAFQDELKAILGRDDFTLPRVFIGGRCIGGADEIRQLHETGELKKVVVGVEAAEPVECEACGGVGFELCSHCNGSHKCYADKGGVQGCSFCNENGLVRCMSCSC